MPNARVVLDQRSEMFQMEVGQTLRGFEDVANEGSQGILIRSLWESPIRVVLPRAVNERGAHDRQTAKKDRAPGASPEEVFMNASKVRRRAADEAGCDAVDGKVMDTASCEREVEGIATTYIGDNLVEDVAVQDGKGDVFARDVGLEFVA